MTQKYIYNNREISFEESPEGVYCISSASDSMCRRCKRLVSTGWYEKFISLYTRLSNVEISDKERESIENELQRI